jgi:hypothetical protein
MRGSTIFLLFIIVLTACSSPPPTPTPTLPAPTPTATEIPLPIISFIDDDLPDASPQRFGEGFFSGSFHSAPVFSPDGETVWWGGEYSTQTIYTSQFQSGAWTEPAIISFSDSIQSYRDPFVSPDGTRFYFISTAALPDGSSSGEENIWMMEKEGEVWSEPQPLPSSVNALALHWTVSVANNYDLYYSAQMDGNTDIFLSRYINGVYIDPVRLDAPVNTEQLEITPNIAPDGSYLLFTRLEGTSDDPRLFITYALDSGWSEPAMVENIPYCISPIITPDRTFVIYLSSPASFDWRDTSFIEELRP